MFAHGPADATAIPKAHHLLPTGFIQVVLEKRLSNGCTTHARMPARLHDPLYTTAATKKSCRDKMPYMISSRSVTDGVSLSVSKSKLVYNSLIFLDN